MKVPARIIAAALLGVVIGAAAVDAALRDHTVDRDDELPGIDRNEAGTRPRARQRRRPAASPGNFTAQARVYERLRAAGLTELISEFDATIESAQSADRIVESSALIAAIAERDVNAALDALTRHTFDRRGSHAVGLALLDGAGVTHGHVIAVMAVLPRVDRVRFIGEAAAALAIETPEDALTLARAFDAKIDRMSALEAVADVVAERDPYTALALADSIPAEPGVIWRPDKLVFQVSALRHLARASFMTATEFVSRELQMNTSQRAKGDLLRALSQEAELVDPLLALEAARQLDSEQARSIERAALERLARESPLDALAYIEDIPGFARRMSLRQQIAEIYGEADPEAALAWVNAQGAAAARLMPAVLQGVAAKDPLRALEIILSAEPSNTSAMIRFSNGGMTSMGRNQFDILQRAIGRRSELPEGVSRDELMATIGERLLVIPDARERRRWVSNFVMSWSQNDPVAVLSWANEHASDVPPWMYSNIAQRFRGDPDAAIQYIDLVPEEARTNWVNSVARELAERNPTAAIEWIEQFSSQASYPELAGQVAVAAVRAQPSEALALLATLPIEQQIRASEQLAMSWVDTDPVAARTWVETLPVGPQRDMALQGMLYGGWGSFRTSAVPATDPTLFTLFSSDAAQERAVFENAQRLAYRNPATARALIETYVTDPALRARAEVQITNVERRR